MNYTIKETDLFRKWFKKQGADIKALVMRRLQRIVNDGEFGDVHKNLKVDGKKVKGLNGLRWSNGLRIYYIIEGQTVVLLLNGGNKGGQESDIKKAYNLLTR